MATKLIEVKDVKFSFGPDSSIIDGVSFDAEKGPVRLAHRS